MNKQKLDIIHEIKTLSSGLISISNIIKEDISSLSKKEIYDLVMVIEETASDLYTLTKNTLDNQQEKLELNKFDIHNVINKCVTLYQNKANNKGISINIESYLTDDYFIVQNKLYLTEIINNLLSNAVKYTEEGNITVKYGEIKSNELYISISDTGIGIKKEKLSTIFNENYMSKISRNEIDSNGMGLSISQKRAKDINGDIIVKSTENIGSIFTLIFTY